MATLKELTLKIASLNNTEKITGAMKLIATTKLSRAQHQVERCLAYAQALQQIKNTLLSGMKEKESSPFFAKKNTAKKVAVLLFTSDRGLCGSFNQNVVKKTQRFLKEKEATGTAVHLDFVGKKGREAFKKRPQAHSQYRSSNFKEVPYHEVMAQADAYLENFFSDRFDAFYVLYNKFVSPLVQQPTLQQLLPVEEKKLESPTTPLSGGGTPSSPKANPEANHRAAVPLWLFEPDASSLLRELLLKQLHFSLFYAYLSSVAGEHAARMTAMDSATKNCGELIERYTLQRNRVRQAAITTELTEIISGAESIH